MPVDKTVKNSVRAGKAVDVTKIAGLINTAFQVEKFFIDGDRISEGEVLRLLDRGSFLVIEGAEGLAGCVYVEMDGHRAYLGLLSVSPSRQGEGLGSALARAAEEHARQSGCRDMHLRVVHLRTELPQFYAKLGYLETGTEPFPSDVSTKLPCHFITMSKLLT